LGFKLSNWTERRKKRKWWQKETAIQENQFDSGGVIFKGEGQGDPISLYPPVKKGTKPMARKNSFMLNHEDAKVIGERKDKKQIMTETKHVGRQEASP